MYNAPAACGLTRRKRVALDAQVHVVKCKDMNGQDASGLGDICFSVEALGETRKTETAKQSRAAVFDETLFFSRKLCTEEYLEEAVIRIVGTDINSWISGNTVIGEHVLVSRYPLIRQDAVVFDRQVQKFTQQFIQAISMAPAFSGRCLKR